MTLAVLERLEKKEDSPVLPTLTESYRPARRLRHYRGVASYVNRNFRRGSRYRLTRTRFAHPAETEFARVLNFYRIRWLYEPRKFPLEWHPDGSVAKMFSPDFYLPDFDLYAELTTQKQSLVTRKNAKVRRLRELYPDVNVKLFYRKDLQRFLARFGVAVSSQTVTPPGGLSAVR
jgi:hypothetical protein